MHALTRRSFIPCLLLAFALATPAVVAQITDLSNWHFYYDNDPGPGPLQDATTGSATSNLAQLNFINNVDVPAAYDIGFSSINANTVAQATDGYYFLASQSFAITLDFAITLTNPNGFVALGLGVGQDRAGVNSAGIGFGVASNPPIAGSLFQGAATNNDTPITKNLSSQILPFINGSTYAGTFNLAYDASTGNITVGATGANGTASTTFTSATDLTTWNGQDLLVSFFLRSDSITSPIAIGPWTGQSAEADFLNFTVLSGSPTFVPEPSSLALITLTSFALIRRRRA